MCVYSVVSYKGAGSHNGVVFRRKCLWSFMSAGEFLRLSWNAVCWILCWLRWVMSTTAASLVFQSFSDDPKKSFFWSNWLKIASLKTEISSLFSHSAFTLLFGVSKSIWYVKNCWNNPPGFIQTLESPEIKCWDFQAWKVLENGIGPGIPWKSPGIVK